MTADSEAVAAADAAGEPRADAPTGRRVVLVVEDDPYAARLIVKALDREPAQVEVAGDAREAIAILSRAQPSVILMDVKLPGTDGVALTTLLKANPTLRHIPVVMLTSDATRETIARSMSAGAAGFIVKPFDRKALLAKLSRYLG
jgi:CheY-like chemotaxis protein